MTVAGGASTLLSNVVGTTSIVSGYSANTLQSVTGTATSNVVQDATVYSFTSGTGTFVVPTGGVIVDYLVVGGGGSGGGGVGGGGGAGGLVYAKGVQLPAGSYTWTVGAGGASVANNTTGNNGSASSLSNAAFGNILALGGGGGGGYASPYTGLPGGSGGGAAGGVSAAYAGGSNATGQGQSGGSAPGLGSGQYSCGGGGAGVAGGANTATAAGAGGNGLAIPITGSNVYYAGGGGGSQQVTPSVPGSLGGLGGGGTGSGQTVYGVTGGAANSGGGGGGASGGTNTAAGGSGVVIIRVYTNTGSRMLIGDGSGYSLALSAQSNAVTTDVMTISDQGNVSIGLPNAVFYYLYGIARDGSNNLYATDNRRIRKINAATGIVTTLAGTGHPTQATIVTGNGTGVNLLGGSAIAYNTSLNVLYFANGASIAVMDSNGNITTFVGSATTGSTDGTGATASFADIRDLVLDNTNTYLYVSDLINSKIRRITVATSNVATMVLGGTGNQLLSLPDGICFDSNSNCLYLANYGKAVICKIPLTGGSLTQTPTVLAGSGGPDANSVDGTGTAASFCRPLGVCVDLTGSNVYVLDGGYGFGSKIRKIVVSTGVVTTIAGGNTVGSLDANGTSALLGYACRTVLIDSFGSNLYFTDNNNNKIRKLNLATCNVTTYAGTGVAGFADGSVPTTTVVNNTLLASSNVGINNNAPAYALDVNGGISTRGGWGQATTGFINLLSPNPVDTTHTGFVEFWSPNAGTRYSYIGYATSTGMDIYSGVPLRIFGANVAIGASAFTPSYTLDVAGSTQLAGNVYVSLSAGQALFIGSNTASGSAGMLRLTNSFGSNYIQSALNLTTGSAAPLLFTTMNGSVEWARFDSNGKLGIGTNAPVGLLSVVFGADTVQDISAWTSNWTLFGPGANSTTGSALGLGYSASQNAAYINALAPNIAWRNLSIIASNIYLSPVSTGVYIGPKGTAPNLPNAPSYMLDVTGTVRATGGYVYSVQTI